MVKLTLQSPCPLSSYLAIVPWGAVAGLPGNDAEHVPKEATRGQESTSLFLNKSIFLWFRSLMKRRIPLPY